MSKENKIQIDNTLENNKQLTLGDITYYDRILQSNYYSYKNSPDLNDFIRHGFLVHVGNISLEYNNPARNIAIKQPTIVPSYFLSYWTMNSPTIASMFYEKGMDIIIKPFARCLDNLASICAAEVMLAGNINIEQGDIVIYNKNPHLFKTYIKEADPRWLNHIKYHIPSEDFAKELKKYGIIPITYDGDFSSNEEQIEKRKEIVKTLLKELNGWNMTFNKKESWTHQTPFKVNEKPVSSDSFFQSILQKFPDVSHGYEFYSKNGVGCLFRVAVDLLIEPEGELLMMKNFEVWLALKTVVLEEIKSYIENFTTYNKEVKIELTKHFNFLLSESENINHTENLCVSGENEENVIFSLELEDLLIIFTTRFSKEVFMRLQPTLKNILSEKIYDIISNTYNLVDNYFNTKDHSTTETLKSSLKDVLTFKMKEFLYSRITDDVYMEQPEEEKLEIVGNWFEDKE